MRALQLVADGPDRVRAQASWTTPLRPNARVFATPLLWEGRVWVVQESGDLTVLDASSGALVATAHLPQGTPGGFYGSPVAADGRVWFGTQSGDLVRARLSPAGGIELDVLPLEPMRSAPVFSGDALYVRTLAALWAFGP